MKQVVFQMHKDSDRLLSHLFLNHARSLTQFLARMVARGEVAEELTQEAFIRLRAMGPTELESPRGFLFRVAQNLALDYLRRANRVPMDSLDDKPGDRFVDRAPNPEEVLAGRQELARVRAVLLELPPKCRQVFLLVRVEGLSQRAVAAETGMSQTMVRKYVSRAVRHLSDRLGPDGR